MEPERKDQEKVPQVPEEVTRREEELPKEVEAIESGVRRTQVQSAPQVPLDSAGKPLVQPPPTQSITVTLPATLQQLDDWAKGDPQNALTWFAAFWLRLIKKALHFGWRIVEKVRGGDINANKPV